MFFSNRRRCRLGAVQALLVLASGNHAKAARSSFRSTHAPAAVRFIAPASLFIAQVSGRATTFTAAIGANDVPSTTTTATPNHTIHITDTSSGNYSQLANAAGTILGVRPCTPVPRFVWRWVWRLHKSLLPLLHWRDEAMSFQQPQQPKEQQVESLSSLSIPSTTTHTTTRLTLDQKNPLRVLWCKALVSLDPHSTVYDAGHWMYDTMPPISRWLLLFSKFYPRLHHAVIEERTAYLNYAIQQEIARLPVTTNIRIISCGAGYDVRCCRMASLLFASSSRQQQRRKVQAVELDLPLVMQAKRCMLERLQRQSSFHPPVVLPELRSVDLHDMDGSVKPLLEDILDAGVGGDTNNDDGRPEECWHTIFVTEGVLMYLEDGVPRQLLKVMSESVTRKKMDHHGQSCRRSRRAAAAVTATHTASLCFADKLVSGENISAADDGKEAVLRELASTGWAVVDWRPKRGKTRHMGCARLLSKGNVA